MDKFCPLTEPDVDLLEKVLRRRSGPVELTHQKTCTDSTMSKSHSLQDPYLNALRKERIAVSIFLVNGIKLQGQIESFDQFVILLKNSVSQMVYKHAISTVVPSQDVVLFDSAQDEDQN